MLKVYGRASSSNVQPVMWCLEELGLQYERIDAGSTFGVIDTPEFRKINPNGLIPALVDGDLAMWESRSIMRYLAAKYGGEALWPSNARQRATVDQWMEWAKTTVDKPFISGVFWGFWRTPVEDHDEEKIDRDWAEVNAAMTLADAQLASNAFLAGDIFTLADISFGTFLFRYMTLPLERPALGNLARYYDLLTSREAYQQHVMLDYAPLFRRLD